MIKIRNWGLLVLATAALSFPAIVGAGGAPEGRAPVIRITYMTHEDPNRTRLEEELIAQFMEQNPDIVVTRVTQPSGVLANTVLTAFAAGQGPTMFNTGITNLTQFLERDRLAPARPEFLGVSSLDAFIGRYVPGTLDPMMRNGSLYGVPLELTNLVILVNDRMFRRAGLDPNVDVPSTWEEMMEVSSQIVVRDGDIIERRGFDFRYGGELLWLPAMVEQLGGQLVSDDGGTAIVNDEAWLQVLSFLQEWGPDGRNLGSPAYTDARRVFNFDNEVAMTHSGQYQFARIRNDNIEFYESREFRGIPFPRWENAVNDVPSPFTGHYWVVNAQASAAEQEAAWRLIAFFASHSVDFWETVGVRMPTNEVLASEGYLNSVSADVFTDELRNGSIVFHALPALRIAAALRDAVNDVMLDGVSPQAALNSLRREAQLAIDEEG